MKPILPQTEPIAMVDDVEFLDNEHVSTSLRLSDAHYLSGEAALVEFAAQSSAALMGCRNRNANIGYIAEVRNFELMRIPEPGELLRCDLEVQAELGSNMLVQVVIRSDGECLAQGRLKLHTNE